jgi:hypothetical protein
MKNHLIILIIIVFESLNTQANPWIQKADFGGVGRHRATGISIANKGYMGLGHVNGTGIDIGYKDWWQYDPASDSWTQKANFPVLNHGAVAFSTSTRGYVGGGSALNGEFYEYNPVSNAWAQIASCPLSVGDVQVFSVANKGYVYLGNQLAEYSPLANTWAMKANAPTTFGTWSTSFSTNSSGFVKSGTTFYEYKPALNQWLVRTSFPGLTSNGGAGFTMNNKGYMTCGYVGSLALVTNEVWEFNPGNNQWTLICEFPGTSRRFPVAFAINNKGYFGTGTNGINMNDFWVFDFDPLGLEENNLSKLNINVFPNPSADQLNFDFSNVEQEIIMNSKIQLFSSDGRKLKEEAIQNTLHTINRADLTNGIYFYSILYKNESVQFGKITFN